MTEYTTEPFFRVFVQFIPGYGPTGWVSTRRIVPMSFRSSLKGMGAAQFRVLSFDETEDEAFSIRTEIREIAIVDNRNRDVSGDFDADLDNILWRGFVTNITTDRYHQDPNSMGQIFAEEYGTGLYKIPITYSEETPNFNPYYDDIQYANFDSGNFRTSDFANRSGVGLPWSITESISAEDVLVQFDGFSELADEYCWNRKKIIEKLVSDSSAVNDVVFPWEAALAQLQAERNQRVSDIVDEGYPPAQQEELIRLEDNKLKQGIENLEASYAWFFDHDIDEISNYEDASLIDAMIDLLPEPFDFYFDINSSSSAPELVIINKSAFDVPGMCPANITLDINIPANDTAILNHNIRSEDIYDRVIVRGAPYLWCGSLTLWGDSYSDKPLLPDWTPEAEKNWLLGTIGGLDEPFLEDPTISNIIRNVYDTVFQKFKFKDGVPIVGQRAGNFGSADESGNFKTNDYNYFFGDFYGIDLEENGDQSKLITPIINVKANRTPNKLATAWESFLPFSRFSDKKIDIDAIQYSLENDRFAEPFLVSPHVRLEDPNAEVMYWVDRSMPFGVASSVEISYHENGIWIRRENPQTDLSQEPSLFRFMKNGTNRVWDVPVEDLSQIDNLELNPVTNEDPSIEGWSNYQKWIVTVAGRSKERLQAYKWRKDAEGNQVPGSDLPKVKIIDVPAEVWLVHPNTVRNVAIRRFAKLDNPFGQFSGNPGESSRDNVGNALIRFLPVEARQQSFEGNPNGVTIVRDDRKLLLQYLEAYSALLLNPRAELNLSLAIDRKYPALSIGRLIGKANDGGIVYDTNSVVASVEYIVETGAPRINIQTSVPNEPLFTQAIHEAQEGKGERPAQRLNTKAPRLFPYRMRDGSAI